MKHVVCGLPSKASYFLEQEIVLLSLGTGWFQEQNWVLFANQSN